MAGLDCSQGDKIEEGPLIGSTDDSLDPYDYHKSKCGGKNAFTKKRLEEFHLYHTIDEDDECIEDTEPTEEVDLENLQ